MTIGGLFSGIGGFELAATWAGITPIWSNEIDSFCCKVLRKNFNHDIIEADIRDCGTGRKYELAPVDIICGGFPCQPFSSAGQRKGKADDRYLWPEMLRAIREVKPAWVVGENVAGILSMDSGAVFEQICASLEDEGYQVETFIIPACGIGAPHRRDRVWIVANAHGNGHGPRHRSGKDSGAPRTMQVEQKERERLRGELGGKDTVIANATGQDDRRYTREQDCRSTQQFRNSSFQGVTADTNGTRLPSTICGEQRSLSETYETPARSEFSRGISAPQQWKEHWLQAATRICGVFNGLSRELDQNRLKNAEKIKRITGQDMPCLWQNIQQEAIQRENRGRNQVPQPEYLFAIPWKLFDRSYRQDNLLFESSPVQEAFLRNVWHGSKVGCPSQGWRYNEQYAKQHSDALSQLSYEVTLAAMEGEKTQRKDRSNRLKALGNAIVPQIAQIIFESILQLENK